MEDWVKDDLALERKRALRGAQCFRGKIPSTVCDSHDGILILDALPGLLIYIDRFSVTSAGTSLGAPPRAGSLAF
jgi:hypothetical protein